MSDLNQPGTSIDPRGIHELDDAVAGVPATERTRALVLEHQRFGGRRRGWLVRRTLMLADIIGLSIAYTGVQAAFGTYDLDPTRATTETIAFLATLPLWIVIAKLYGLYARDEVRNDHSTFDDVVGVFHLVTVGTWLTYCATTLTHVATPQLSKVFAFWLTATAAIVVTRGLARMFARTNLAYIQNVIIVGDGPLGRMIARKLQQHPEYGLHLVGFVTDSPRDRATSPAPLLGTTDEIAELSRLLDVERLIVADPCDEDEVVGLVRSLVDVEAQIDLVPRNWELLSRNAAIHTIEGVPVLGLPALRLSRSARIAKRTVDVLVSAASLALLAPLFALVALLIKRDSAGPVFFRQDRMGAGSQVFRVFKFRTMPTDADVRKYEFAHLNEHLGPGRDPRMFKILDDPRVTHVGRVLRRYFVDELPQLINVLRGEMSLVGPRPLILDEDAHVREWARRRLDLRPGMTGPWQVFGRNAISFEEMIKLDYLYVTTWSMATDLRLLWKTLPLVLRGGGGSY